MLHSQCIAALVLLLLLAAGCDSADPAVDRPEPFFEATLLDEQGQTSSMEGTAQLVTEAFDQGIFLSLPFGEIEDDRQATVIHLAASGGEAEHTISFVHVGEDRPASGETLSILASVRSFTPGEDAPSDDGPERKDELTSAAYQQTTSDSLFAYLPGEGTLEIESASEDVVTGTFIIEIAALHVISLSDRPPFEDRPVSISDPDDYPGRFQFLAEPFVLEGSFTAVSPEER